MSHNPSSPMTKTWEVSVNVNGETVLTIGSNHLSGRENLDDYIDIIQNCGQHLTSFIGRPHAPATPAPGDVGEIVREALDIAIMARAMRANNQGGVDVYLAGRMLAIIEKQAGALSSSSAETHTPPAREPTPQWERRWPHDQPNGWNLDAAKFLALVQSAEGMMWIALGRAKYLELRIDTRDGGFNLYDRDGKPLNPDDVVAAVEEVKAKYGVGDPVE